MHSLAFLTPFLTLSLATPVFEPQPRSPPEQKQCNGNHALCDRKYSNITFIGAHDSPFVGTSADLASNQNVDVHAQLTAGIRFLSVQAHKNHAGDLHLCHTYCWEYDAGPLRNYLTTVKKWMDANPNEVVTLLLVNGGFYDVSLYDDAFQSTGLAPLTFQPHKDPLALHEWPTLGEMVANSTRLVVFMDYHANLTSAPYIIPEFEHYYFETPFDTTDPGFPQCAVDRPAGATGEGRMIGMNHFLDVSVFGTSIKIPDNGKDEQTNAADGWGSIGAQAEVCARVHGRYPNFVLVDRFDTGHVFEAQRRMNFPDHY